MSGGWKDIIKAFRERHGLSQSRMAAMVGVSQRTISRWERGDDNPSSKQQIQLRDLGWEPSPSLLSGLRAAVTYCPAPRALSRTQNLQLQVLSGPALTKRPSIANWVGRNLVEIAEGVLREMLDDRALQRAIAKKEICAVVTTTRSVLRSAESAHVGVFRTTIGYFFHEGTLYSDAVAMPAPANASTGYETITMDNFISSISQTGGMPRR